MNFSILENNKGYTLMELLVAVAIIAVIASVTVLGVNKGNNKQKLLREAQKVNLDIRKAQNLALSPKGGGSSVCFYGFKIESVNSYFIYYGVNCNGQKRYTNSIQTPKIKTFSLASGVEFSNTGDDIAFLPPEPIAYFNNADNFSPQDIVLRLSNDFAETRTLTINKFGNIEVK